jgi:hypothetical protein
MQAQGDRASADDRTAIREAVRKLCADYPDSYWRDIDRREQHVGRVERSETRRREC